MNGKLTALDPLLASNALDAKLAKFFVITEATPTALESFAGQGAARKKLLEPLLADDALLLQIAIADGARPLHAKGKAASPPNYGKVMEIYTAMEYSVTAPKAGDYKLISRVVTSNVNQLLQLAVNGAETPTTITLPFTIGKWGESEPVTVTLKQGANTLRFWRDHAPQRGVAVKTFTLMPVNTK